MSVRVKLIFGDTERTCHLADDALVASLISALVTALARDGFPPLRGASYYCLRHGSRDLEDSDTLAHAGVKDGDELVLAEREDLAFRLQDLFRSQGKRFLPRHTKADRRKDPGDARPDQQTDQEGKTTGQHLAFNGGDGKYSPTNESELDLPRAFVVMPFGHDFDNLYRFAIEPTLVRAGLHPIRGDSFFSNTDIFTKICHCISDSCVNIVDVSVLNANVFLELGLILGMKRKAILIKKHDSKLASDLHGLEYVEYDDFLSFRRPLLRAIWQSTGAQNLREQTCLERECARIIGNVNFFICIEDGSIYHTSCWYKIGKCVKCEGTDVIEIRK